MRTKNMVLRCSFLSYSLLFVLLVTVVGSNGQNLAWRIDDEGCITPNGETGNCIPVRMCPAMMKALSTVKRPLSEKARLQLELYICSIKTQEYKVCCSPGPVIIEEERPTVTVENRDSDDISQHPNFNLLPINCGYVDLGSFRVINGENADLTEYPWMSLLSYRGIDNRKHFKCGGTIINSRYILTAAHCLEERSKLLGVRVGEYDVSKKTDCNRMACNDPVQDLTVEEIIIHPQYQSKNKINDIGLLRVTPIRFNEKNIRPVCLPRGRNKELEGEYAEVSGWGVTQQFSSRQSNILQKARLRVINKTECREIYKNYTEIDIDDTRICAGGGQNQANACSGDSGGPIQEQQHLNGVRYIQHGIVSIGINGCIAPEVFTKVAYYMNWILDNIKP